MTERYMTDKDRLNLIAKELREFASAAYGIPTTVQITANTLNQYARYLEQISDRMVEL